ncbi:MAG TPA: hypothetical protein VMX13_10670 [Sedimentisphaerales bacterium]|nr:hypothetical protein [Sedimentisphaerales bacterium]
MRETTNHIARKSESGRLGLCLAAVVICATIIDGKSLAHHVLQINDFYVRANKSDPNETEADVCKCGYWVYVEWWATTNNGTFDIEIWQPGEPCGPANNDFYDDDDPGPLGTKVGEISHTTSGRYTDSNVFEVNDVDALTTGEHTIRAWVRNHDTRPPNAWEYSENSCTVNLVEMVSVGETSTEVCVDSDVNFTGNSSGGTLACLQWQRQYRVDSNSSWGSWEPAGTGPTTVLNTGVAGQYQYQAQNGDDANCAPWKQSSIVDVVKVENVTFSPDALCADGSSTSTASATITPSSRDITWSIHGDGLGCSIDPNSGVITAGTSPGTICVWATDANVSGCHAEGELDVVKVEITDADGNPITAPQTVCVGEKISLKGKVEPSGMTGSWQWTVPGTVVKDYVDDEALTGSPAGRTTAYVVDLTAADKQLSTIDFYWVDGADGRDVALEWTGDLTSCSDTVTFNVKGPTLNSFTSDTPGTIYVNTGVSPPRLDYGTSSVPGCKWHAGVTGPTGFDGQFKFVQVNKGSCVLTKTDDSTCTRSVDNWWLDSDNPYGGPWSLPGGDTETYDSEDRPGKTLNVGFKKAEIIDWDFKVYVMWRSVLSNTIWVPVGRLNWGWDAVATSDDGGNTWTLSSGSSATRTSGATTEFAEWPDTAKGGSPPYPDFECE